MVYFRTKKKSQKNLAKKPQKRNVYQKPEVENLKNKTKNGNRNMFVSCNGNTQ